jgi:5-methylcytosine-specific restriction enzyme subunit McrC
MSNLIVIHEHYEDFHELSLQKNESYNIYFWKQKRNERCSCLEVFPSEDGHTIASSYFIGVDWIGEQTHAVYVEPKVNKAGPQVNYLEMLFSALKHPDVANHTNDLFEIKFDQPPIKISREQDLLTPLLVVQFLSVVKEIVRKGLKKSYYRVDQHLYGRVKGKVLVSSTIKHNLLKNNPLKTHCSFEEFGLNGLENRLLKKALIFVQRYLPAIKNLNSGCYTENMMGYILPAFESVSEDVSLNDIKHQKKNVFYKEYEEGVRLAKLILQRFGYNLSNVDHADTIQTPPFWIDMSKMFELYVLGLLLDQFGRHQLTYHYTRSGNEIDYLLKTPEYQMVIDAKYKLKYDQHFENADIRQVSGYARLKDVYKYLGKAETEIIDCLIIYPVVNLPVASLSPECLKANIIDSYVQFYRLGIGLPVQKTSIQENIR